MSLQVDEDGDEYIECQPGIIVAVDI